MVVGQDWGSLNLKGETIVKAIEDETYDRNSFQYMKGNKNLTNKTIQKLFDNLGISLESDKNEKKELFFTNFIPWYRADGEKSSGGSLQE